MTPTSLREARLRALQLGELPRIEDFVSICETLEDAIAELDSGGEPAYAIRELQDELSTCKADLGRRLAEVDDLEDERDALAARVYQLETMVPANDSSLRESAQ